MQTSCVGEPRGPAACAAAVVDVAARGEGWPTRADEPAVRADGAGVLGGGGEGSPLPFSPAVRDNSTAVCAVVLLTGELAAAIDEGGGGSVFEPGVCTFPEPVRGGAVRFCATLLLMLSRVFGAVTAVDGAPIFEFCDVGAVDFC